MSKTNVVTHARIVPVKKVKAKKRAKLEVTLFEVVAAPEGPCLYINGYRVAGPKPYGGGEVLYTFTAVAEDFEGTNLSYKK